MGLYLSHDGPLPLFSLDRIPAYYEYGPLSSAGILAIDMAPSAY